MTPHASNPHSRTSTTAAWAALAACALNAAIILGLADLVTAAERGWAPVIVTGSLPVEPTRPSRARTLRKSSEQHETAAAPAAEAKPSQPPAASARPAKERPRPAPTPEGPGEQYCANIADAAADARFAWQKRMLADLEKDIEQRIARLETKTAEYQKWLARRDEFVKRAQESLVGIYARMRPDAAALQLAASDEETAAAVLSKLDTRVASSILAEMEPNQAARLASIMAGAARVQPASNSRAAADGRKS